MLYHHRPLAQRRATTGRVPRQRQLCTPSATPPTGPDLSVTLDTIKGGATYAHRLVRSARTGTPDHHLIIVSDDDIEYERLAWDYARHLPEWAKRRIFVPLGVIDPTVNLVGYLRTRWWRDGWTLGPAAASLLEGAAGPTVITPWRHPWMNTPARKP